MHLICIFLVYVVYMSHRKRSLYINGLAGGRGRPNPLILKELTIVERIDCKLVFRFISEDNSITFHKFVLSSWVKKSMDKIRLSKSFNCAVVFVSTKSHEVSAWCHILFFLRWRLILLITNVRCLIFCTTSCSLPSFIPAKMPLSSFLSFFLFINNLCMILPHPFPIEANRLEKLR